MIYSASRRTDMPAHFPDAIVERVDRSRKLEAIVFWTKDIRNFVRHPSLNRVIRTVPSIVQYTVTGLAGGVWEPNVCPLAGQLVELSELAGILPPGAIHWRFDPVLPDAGVLRRFRETKSALESILGPVDSATISFPDPYRKAVARTGAAGLAWPTLDRPGKESLIAMMAAEFAPPGDGGEECRPIRLCCEPDLLGLPGVSRAKCVDGALVERLYGAPLGDLRKDGGQRAACGCVKSTDIGSYGMRCPHRCLYCYANPE